MTTAVATTIFGFLLATSAHAASLDYINSGELVISPAAPEAVRIKPLAVPYPARMLLSFAPAMYCRKLDGSATWAQVRCVVRFVDTDAKVRYRRGMRTGHPEPPTDAFPGGVDVDGWVWESACEAEEMLQALIMCNVTATMAVE